jgi:Skp family chaperone for outer membrane proteins
MNEQRTQYIKQQKEEAKARLEQEKQARLAQYQQDYERRVSEEEMELISRLQNTQTVQRSAYEELEAALGSTTRASPRETSPPGPPKAK